MRLHLEYPIQVWGPEYKGAVGEGPEKGHKDDQGTGAPPYEDRLRELGLFSLEKRRLQSDLTAAFNT